MSSDSTYTPRASRRTDRDPPPAKRASAGVATAILIMAAIFGFSIGAVAATLSGGGDDDPAAANGDPVAEATETTSDSTTDDSDDVDENSDDNDAALAGNGAIVLESSYDGGTATGGEEGDRLDFTVSVHPPEPGLTLILQRSLDGGATWENFGTNPRPVTLNDNGRATDEIWSGRPGPNYYRYVEIVDDDVVRESNPVVITIEN